MHKASSAGVMKMGWGVEKDKQKAVEWYTRAAERGYARREPERWKDVLKYAGRMRKGGTFPPSVFLAPSLTSEEKYRMLDGARRIMASVEAEKNETVCIVLRKRTVI